jgi:hypothetical protein
LKSSRLTKAIFFRFPVGDTKVRILTDFFIVHTLYKGVYPNSKYEGIALKATDVKEGCTVKTSAWAWGIVRGKEKGTDTLKILQFPKALLYPLHALENSPDWEGMFSSFPHGADIVISNTGEGPNRYSIQPTPKKTTVPNDVLDELGKHPTCEDIVKRIVAKQDEKKGSVDTSPYTMESSDDIPFE